MRQHYRFRQLLSIVAVAMAMLALLVVAVAWLTDTVSGALWLNNLLTQHASNTARHFV